jgi:hypothetical protein
VQSLPACSEKYVMEQVRTEINSTIVTTATKPFSSLPENQGNLFPNVSVRQGLCRWYNLFSSATAFADTSLFPETGKEDILYGFFKDMELLPAALMEEMTSGSVNDKEQYIRLVQAFLINISDELPVEDDSCKEIQEAIERNIHFIQNFFYQYFDNHYRVSKFSINNYCNSVFLKLEYCKIKSAEPLLMDCIKQALAEKCIKGETALTFRQKEYLQLFFRQIDTTNANIEANNFRSLLKYFNFNHPCFIDYEIEMIKSKLSEKLKTDESCLFLQQELTEVNNLKHKTGFSIEPSMPSIRQQLSAWISQEVHKHEQEKNRSSGKDLMIDADSKIQTSLSVAKLAVIVRLLVADKIIINKTVAPMLRTISKLFTTLQRDEISFGSLETKYHAPDKTTLNIVREMLQKWALLTSKL